MKRISKTAIIIVAILSAIVFASFSDSGDTAQAIEREKELTVVQSSKIWYCGENYLTNATMQNRFLSAFDVFLDGEKTNVNATNTVFSASGELYAPGAYTCTFSYTDSDGTYVRDNVQVVVSKKPVTVTVLLNGVTDLTVAEGEQINVLYNYDGGVTKDEELVVLNGIRTTVLKDEVLLSKAFVEYIPKETVRNYTVVASNARSDYYDFSYAQSKLTVEDAIVPVLTFDYKGDTLVSLTGHFSAVSTLDYNDIGTSSTSETYTAYLEKAKERFLGQTVLDDNDILGCYAINVYKFGEIPEGNVEASVSLTLAKSLWKRSSYNVLALYNNGDVEVLNAKLDADGVLTFFAADLGVFMVMSPTQGITATTYVIVVSVGVVVVILVIFFVSLFRRKY